MTPSRFLLLLCLCLWSLPALTCEARSRGTIRPAARDAKVGAMGKDYVFLTEACTVVTGTFEVWTSFLILPAGQYRVKYEDDLGFYLSAPSSLQAVNQNRLQKTANPAEGGLYIRKDRPTEVHAYRVDKQTSQIVPPNLGGTPLDRSALKKIRQ